MLTVVKTHTWPWLALVLFTIKGCKSAASNYFGDQIISEFPAGDILISVITDSKIGEANAIYTDIAAVYMCYTIM